MAPAGRRGQFLLLQIARAKRRAPAGELEHEIKRETVNIASDSEIEVAGGDLVELGQARIEHDFFAAHDVDNSNSAPRILLHSLSLGPGSVAQPLFTNSYEASKALEAGLAPAQAHM